VTKKKVLKYFRQNGEGKIIYPGKVGKREVSMAEFFNLRMERHLVPDTVTLFIKTVTHKSA
jgi:hypothetical protein